MITNMNDCDYSSYDDMAYDTDAYYWDLEESDYDNSVKNKKYV